MSGINVTNMTRRGEPGASLFVEVGRFLTENRLAPHPANYAFVYGILSEPRSMMARTVTSLTEGGFRLSESDIASLGGEAVGGPATVVEIAEPAAANDTPGPEVEALLARTQVQVDGVADVMRSMHAHTSGFGRDLAASAAAVRDAGVTASVERIAELAAAMLERVRRAEAQLADATRETETLRHALDAARGDALRDPLTDLANRRAFDEAFAAVGTGERVVVAICDIDHFKRVNDDFGHNVGDRVLAAIGRALTEHCAPHLIARYGGEEFALLARGTDRRAIAVMLNAARTSIAARRFRSRDTGDLIGTVTFSAGLAEVNGGSREEALHAADLALYAAKAGGRNAVVDARTIGA